MAYLQLVPQVPQSIQVAMVERARLLQLIRMRKVDHAHLREQDAAREGTQVVGGSRAPRRGRGDGGGLASARASAGCA